MSIPAGWSRSRVFLSGNGSKISNILQNPIQDVVFATLISSKFDGYYILAIDGLNRSQASVRDITGATRKFNYFIATSASVQNETPRFPTKVFSTQTISEITVRWLTMFGDPREFEESTEICVELELWSYSN